MQSHDMSREELDSYSMRGRVYHQIREDILSGRYRDNDELKEVAIGKKLGVSRTPVREALRQLELEGLVHIIPNRGAFVRGISGKDIHDIYMIRSHLEGMCARLAVEGITQEQLDQMEKNVYLFEFETKKGHLDQTIELDNEFHRILYAAAGSKMLSHLMEDYHQYVKLIRKTSLSTPERSLISNQEHRNIMEALRMKNGDLAEKYASEHIHNAYANMVKNGLYNLYPLGENDRTEPF